MIWKPNQKIPYVMECLEDDTFFLHHTALIWPSVEEDKEGDCFVYMLNRTHEMHGEILECTEDTLTITAKGNRIYDDHTFRIRPFREEDLSWAREKYDPREQWLHTVQDLYDAYEKDQDW